MHQMTTSTIMTFITVKIKMTFTHATNLSNTFALPQFMAQHSCEYQDPADDPSEVPTAFQASCDHTFKPKCSHNPTVT